MMRLLLCLLMLSTPAQAGPWLRDKGSGFISWHVTGEDPEQSGAARVYTGIFAEYGMRDDLTLGLDLGGDENGYHKAMAFAVMPVRVIGRPQTRLSMEFSMGVIDSEPIYRHGVSVGQSLQLLGRSGWFSIDGKAGFSIEDASMDLSTDFTIGINSGARTKLILQLQQGGEMRNPDYLRVVQSIVFERKPGRHLELGVTAGLINAPRYGLKLGLWRSF